MSKKKKLQKHYNQKKVTALAKSMGLSGNLKHKDILYELEKREGKLNGNSLIEKTSNLYLFTNSHASNQSLGTMKVPIFTVWE